MLIRKLVFNEQGLSKMKATLIFFISVLPFSTAEVGLSVKLTSGHILEGFKVTASGQEANAWLGVPFAEAPVGELRFQKPRSLAPSTDYVSCKAYKPACYQNHSLIADKRIREMSEDCLYLNIFSGSDCTSKNGCPVLYYIHGGAYEFDSPVLFPVDVLVENFASKGLVLVTVAYRLGALGFWSTGTEEAPGNYGVYDVLEGLKWTQSEINAFGGDPARVTIMGQSAGAGVASLLTLTPESKGLFQRAVLMSRAPVITEELSQYQDLARLVGCSSKNDWISEDTKKSIIVDCMRKIDAKYLIDSYREAEMSYELDEDKHVTAPRVDGPNGLFPESLDRLIANRRPIDAIIGTTAEEYGLNKFIFIDATAENLDELCRREIERLDVENERVLVSECQKLYVQKPMNEKINRSKKFSVWTEQTAKLKSDLFFNSPAFGEASSLVRAGANVFLYSFDYAKKGLEEIAPWHAFDLAYLLGVHPFEFDERDHQIKSYYVSYFVNFAKYGHPTPSTDSWQRLRNPPSEMNYMSIDWPQPSMKPRYHDETVLFWNYFVPSVGQTKTRVGERIPFQNWKLESQGQRSQSSRSEFLTVLVLVACFALILIGLLFYAAGKRRNTIKGENLLKRTPSDYKTFMNINNFSV